MSGVKGRSGGKRENTRLKSKLSDPTVKADWLQHLQRAITAAMSNGTVLRKKAFFAANEIKATFGKAALVEFKSWFEANKHFDQALGDDLAQQFAKGKIDEVKFQRLLYSKAFFWIWSIKPEKQRQAWELSRGARAL